MPRSDMMTTFEKKFNEIDKIDKVNKIEQIDEFLI